ncbi:MAG: KamA family radical SAM protein [Kofleriaceae bacterium]|nr:KamA family radical SAM protein [Myxococcales bacterium]MCB9561053.1 KamA family radical SAM protein [Kofleriaceae bacterium]
MPLPLAARSLRRADVAERDWLDWRWQLRNMLTSADELGAVLELAPEERAGLAASAHLFRVGITPYYASLMDPAHPSCPVRMQAIPAAREGAIRDEELRDPLGEDSHNPAPCVVHKYPDRCLFLVVDRCAIYCRHCNRRRLVGGDDPPTTPEIEAGLAYIARTPRIRDVLISGGDPLLLSTAKLDHLLGRLRAIPHVEIIRIGTRIPVVCPMRVDDELCAALRKHHPLYVNTHFNHPKELTPESRAACARLVDAGIPVGNQAVLLRGVNSSVRTLRALMRELLKARVKPYYLFQGDTVIGTDHLRTPVDAAIELYGKLRGWMTGMGVPHLVIDAPGGGGKLPIVPSYIEELGDEVVKVRTYRGAIVDYPQPRERDCTVPYDDVYFAGVPEDDDREGSAEALEPADA